MALTKNGLMVVVLIAFFAIDVGIMNAAEEKIVFSSRRDGNYEIYMMNPNGSSQTQLTYNNTSWEFNPRWSPDGTKIAFISDRDVSVRGEEYQIYVMNPDGSNQTRLTYGVHCAFGPAWSPDGTKIAFWAEEYNNTDGNYEYYGDYIYVMNANGSDLRKLTDDLPYYFPYSEPVWSPNGTKIAYSGRGLSDEGFYCNVIFVMNSDGFGEKIQLTHVQSFSPSWSPDGTKIAFTAPETTSWKIWVINADGSALTKLTDGSDSVDGHPDWSPDGTKIAFESSRYGNQDIVVMNQDGTELTQLTDNPGYDLEPDWWGITATDVIDKIDRVKDAVKDLEADDFKKPNMQDTLTNSIDRVKVLIDGEQKGREPIDVSYNSASIGNGHQTVDQNQYKAALSILRNDILPKMDGCARTGEPDRDDWIIDCPAQGSVYPIIVDLIELLEMVM